MHENDRYDELHAELASGEGMPEARQPPGLHMMAAVTDASTAATDPQAE